jgi:endonuclease/exonuclease/phosphatase family metal-dependent hydrolase
VRVTIGSYNLHAFVGTDGQRDVARCARVIHALSAEVVALQEVVFADSASGAPEPLEMLEMLAGYQAVSAPIARRDGLAFGNVVLTRLPVLSQRRICLDYGDHEPRTALEVVLETGARPLRVVATHLGLRPVERRHQVRTILAHVAGDERSVTVLLGDFNEWFLLGRPLRWLHARFGRGYALPSYPSRFPLFALDRIWAHPRGALANFRTYSAGEARVASDHLPVIAEVDVSSGAQLGNDAPAPRFAVGKTRP